MIDTADDSNWSGNVGTQGAGDSVDRTIGGYYVDWIAGLGLEDRGELPVFDEPIPAEGQIANSSGDQAVRRVEVGEPAVAAQRVTVLHNDALRAERVVVE